jgi:hypothetical protein
MKIGIHADSGYGGRDPSQARERKIGSVSV